MRRVWAVLVVLACTLAFSAMAPGAGAATPHRVHSLLNRLLHWDPKLAPIAAEVEVIRGLKFERAVPVHYLADAAFEKKLLHKDNPNPSKAQTASFKRSENLLRALGLLDHDIDLHATTRKALGAGTLAFYDPLSRDIYVRGTDTMDPATRVTLAHELTHALQDQHFNLFKMQYLAAQHHNATVVKAIIEGDATYVQHKFAEKLSGASKQAYEAAQTDETKQARALDVPEVIKVELSAPYALGEGLVATVRAAKGRAGEDKLFTDPPTSELALVDPSTVVAGVKPVSVATPKLAKGEKRDGKPDDLGAFGLFTVLASRLPVADAIGAADHWRGDKLVQFTSGGRSCVRADVVGRDPAATEQIRGALASWTAASGVGGATATQVAFRGSAGRAELTSCAPTGATTPIPPNTLLNATELLVGRNTLTNELATVLGSTARAQCAATKFVAIPEFLALISATEAGTMSVDDGRGQVQDVLLSHRDEIFASCA